MMMRPSLASLLLLLACLRAAGQYFTAVPEDEGVIVLTKDTFDDALEEHAVLLVEFYAPWCGHCKKLAPEYVKAAAALRLEDPPLRIAKVDATEEKELSERYGVRGFPTLKLFQRGGGRVSEYDGARTSADIVEFVKRKAGPPATTLTTAGDFEKFKASADVVVIGFFDDADSAPARTFLAAATSEDAIAFAISTDVTIGEGESANTAVLLKTFDEGRNVLPMTASTTEAELQEFISGHSMPLVIMFSSDKAKTIFRGPIKIHTLVFVDMAESAKVDEILAMLGEVATETRGKVLHIYVPSSEERILDYFGIANERLPQLMLADMSLDDGMKKYRFTGDELTADAVRAFEAAFFEGALLPDLKSEEPAEDDLSEPVKKLVGKTFAKHVLENDKDVLVEFYAPWCGHCKALEPKWDELAEKFAPVESIMVAKMDATANEIDVEGVSIRGFPTIFYFPGDAKRAPFAYDSSRDVEGFTAFLQRHATKPWSLDADGGGGGTHGGPGHRDEL